MRVMRDLSRARARVSLSLSFFPRARGSRSKIDPIKIAGFRARPGCVYVCGEV